MRQTCHAQWAHAPVRGVPRAYAEDHAVAMRGTQATTTVESGDAPMMTEQGRWAVVLLVVGAFGGSILTICAAAAGYLIGRASW